jgi:hypothetical protein
VDFREVSGAKPDLQGDFREVDFGEGRVYLQPWHTITTIAATIITDMGMSTR